MKKIVFNAIYLLFSICAFGQINPPGPSYSDVRLPIQYTKEVSFIAFNDVNPIILTYSITNDSDSTITIERIKPSCNCLKCFIKGDIMTIQPHSTISMKVYFDTEGKIGEQHKSVTVYFTNLTSILLRLSGEIKEAL